MTTRLRKFIATATETAIIVAAVTFAALWVIGPFVRLGAVVPLPFTHNTFDVHAGAGMVHVTVNHDNPSNGGWRVYQMGLYPAARRDLYISHYLSLKLPKSFGQKTSFGSKTWVRRWTGNITAPRYTRYWFPIIVPAAIFGTMAIGLLARWRFRQIKRQNDQSPPSKPAAAPPEFTE